MMSDNKNENEKREMLADIVADFRQYVENTKMQPEVAETIGCYLGRIEAAWKREKAELVYAYDPTKAGNGRLPDGSAYALKAMREHVTEHPPVSNAAAMREALRYIVNLIDKNPDRLSAGQLLCIIGDKAEAAISTPARNCDLYESQHDAKVAFLKYHNMICELKGKDEYDLGDIKHNVNDIGLEYAEWLLAQTAERKGDGDGR